MALGIFSLVSLASKGHLSCKLKLHVLNKTDKVQKNVMCVAFCQGVFCGDGVTSCEFES